MIFVHSKWPLWLLTNNIYYGKHLYNVALQYNSVFTLTAFKKMPLKFNYRKLNSWSSNLSVIGWQREKEKEVTLDNFLIYFIFQEQITLGLELGHLFRGPHHLNFMWEQKVRALSTHLNPSLRLKYPQRRTILINWWKWMVTMSKATVSDL